MRLIVDASVAIKWVIDEPDSAEAIAIRKHTLLAPELMYVECCNILWKCVQRRQFDAAFALRRMDVLTSFTVTHVPALALARRALEIALELRHPAYDALYLAVADVEAARVVTADARLLNRVANTPFAPLAISLQDAAAN